MKIGQVCIKTKGKEAGRKVIVLSEPKNGRVLIDGIKVKRRQCNVMHLFPTGKIVQIEENASHEKVVKLLEEINF